MRHSFRRKEHVVTMASQNVIKIRDAMIPLDPQLLFQRLVTAGMRQERMGEVFTYELCSYPPSMFENRHNLLPADKPALAEALWKLMPMETPLLVGDINFVLDGVAQSSLATELDIWRNMLAVLQVCWTTLWPSFSGVWWVFWWSQHKRCCSSTKSWWPNRAINEYNLSHGLQWKEKTLSQKQRQ